MPDTTTTPRRPIREGLLTGDLADTARIRLLGTRCATCGATALGERATCPACSAPSVTHVPLSDRGTLWTYTVVRYRPPGDYRGPEPFEPFGIGLVEVPEGVRVMSPIRCAPEALAIGMPLVFVPEVRTDPDGAEVVAFAFAPAANGGRDD